MLYKRTFTEIIRNPTLLLMHCVMALAMGLLCGGIFWKISNDIAGAQNRLGELARPALLPQLSCFTASLSCLSSSMKGRSFDQRMIERLTLPRDTQR